ncbi:MAG: hypothetical protein NTU85_00835 [Candidatus Kaiserbacteria bacterium]|nr:hypothetical protein [Candidatus Kaiserbacteria bacterium]
MEEYMVIANVKWREIFVRPSGMGLDSVEDTRPKSLSLFERFKSPNLEAARTKANSLFGKFERKLSKKRGSLRNYMPVEPGDEVRIFAKVLRRR